MNGKPLQRRFVGGVIGLLVGILSVCVTPAARAQFSANFQTNVISGVTSNWGGNGTYVVGSNTFLDALQVLSGGVLSNGGGYLGYEISGSNNIAVVAGTGSVWSNFASLYIGYNSVGNQLSITNGGRVNSPATYMGYVGSSSNNIALVSGTGSVWNVSFFNVGRFGGRNQLIVTNGGMVVGGAGSIYIGDSSDSNVVTVSGSGSVLRGLVTMGNTGAGNRLTISGGGLVDGGMYIGGNGAGSSNNVVTVSGAGSVWTNTSLSVGYYGSGNQLIVTNGGVVNGGSFNFTYIGYNTSASNNAATITGNGSVWSCGTSLDMGEATGSSNRLTVSNGGAVLVGTWGYIGRFSGNNAATVSDPGSVLSIGNELYVGLGGAGNSLVISNGAKVADPHGYVGGYAVAGGGTASSNNGVVVTGSGSVWSNLTDVYIGASGQHNSLTITNGGVVYSGTGFIGYANSGSNNTVLVAGTGAMWIDNGNLYVGYDGSSNQLTIAANASVVASNAYISYKSDAIANQINVAGGSLYVTNAAHNAVLDVRCGQLNVSSGLLQVDILICTNACGHISHTGGSLIVGSLVLDPNLDADNDGLPNGWEQAHGLDPLSGGGNDGANGDPDGDGFTNLQEFQAGTDPTNSGSAFRITNVVSTGSNVLVTWMTGVGKTNALQWTAGAGDGSYATNSFADLFIVTNTIGTTTNYLDVGGATNSPARYYRLRLIP